MRKKFSEFEAYTESIQDADLRMMLACVDRLQWSLESVTPCDAIHIQKGREGSPSITMGAGRTDGVVFYMQRSDGVSTANGFELGPGSAFCMTPGSEFCLVDGGSNDWISIFVAKATAAACGLPVSGDARVFDAIQPTRALWSLANRILEANEVDPRLAPSRASSAALEEMLLSHLRSLSGSKGASRNLSPRGRRRVVDRRFVCSAVEMIEDGPDHIATVRDLAKLTGAPERTLREGFQKYLGTTPRRYIQLSRLHEARRRLCHPRHDAVTVTEVAAEVGMWDFGRFAERYRQAFGELPSQTLARAKQR